MNTIEQQTILACRKALAAAFANRCDEDKLERPLGVLKLCRERPHLAAWVTIENPSWALAYRPVSVGEVTR